MTHYIFWQNLRGIIHGSKISNRKNFPSKILDLNLWWMGVVVGFVCCSIPSSTACKNRFTACTKRLTYGHISWSSLCDVANPRSLLSVTTLRGSVHLDMASGAHSSGLWLITSSKEQTETKKKNVNNWVTIYSRGSNTFCIVGQRPAKLSS